MFHPLKALIESLDRSTTTVNLKKIRTCTTFDAVVCPVSFLKQFPWQFDFTRNPQKNQYRIKRVPQRPYFS